MLPHLTDEDTGLKGDRFKVTLGPQGQVPSAQTLCEAA